jgi:serine/threonine protein kinase
VQRGSGVTWDTTSPSRCSSTWTLSCSDESGTGTPRFASPEALAGGPAGPPYDVYGLAATLYTLFAGGSPPYAIPPGASIAALRKHQIEERPEALRIRAPDVGPDVERALMQALAFKAMERPAAGQLVLTLERAHPPR